jgi:hypothetical protein
VRAHRRPRPVARQLQGRDAAELPLPEAELPLEQLAPQPLPLPEGEIEVLDLEVRQGRRVLPQEGVVEDLQLVKEDALDQPS